MVKMGYGVRKIPTAVADFDAIVHGGLPEGSVVLLLGDMGAGQHEFIYTSASKLSIVKEHPMYFNNYCGTFCDISGMPEKICYISFSRPKEDILREISSSFNQDFHDSVKRKMIFKDLSASYFSKTIVPSSWTHKDNGGENGGTGGDEDLLVFSSSPKESVLESLVNFLDENAQGSMIIIDSLTDLVVSNTVDISELIGVLRGIQRAAKRWNGVIYLLLTKGVMDKQEEQMVLDSVDGVLTFEWSHYLRTTKRQRYLYIQKFMSVLPHIENDRLVKFPTRVSSANGLTVVNMDVIS